MDLGLNNRIAFVTGASMGMARECLPYLEKSDQARIINIGGHRGREPGPYSVSGTRIAVDGGNSAGI